VHVLQQGTVASPGEPAGHDINDDIKRLAKSVEGRPFLSTATRPACLSSRRWAIRVVLLAIALPASSCRSVSPHARPPPWRCPGSLKAGHPCVGSTTRTPRAS